ncbi:hypothetical protein D9758_005336 [Tetrapyrgos nigripes]|uniref:Transmembrane protein n=1 Tax=Tetrapyrgos nigripes TaxID=182062 RepID=A0A8H5LPY7_9AGAR|nr:hypothetical protein D9758_005336 [Tetrapyrgos nigripes]
MHLPCNPVEFNLKGLSKLPLCSPPLLLWFVAAVGLLLALRSVFTRLRSAPVNAEKGKRASQEVQQEKKSVSWRFLTLDSLPVSLPMTLVAPPANTMAGRGVGLNAGSVLSRPPSQQGSMAQVPRSPSPPQWRGRRGPTFDQPVPSIYQSQEPISMAKIIMSRHTFRRPAPPKPAPRRSKSLPPSSSPSSRPQSMV